MAAVPLFKDTNTAAVMSHENTLLAEINYSMTSKVFCLPVIRQIQIELQTDEKAGFKIEEFCNFMINFRVEQHDSVTSLLDGNNVFAVTNVFREEFNFPTRCH